MPNVGKSTLFQAITKKQVDCANYPFCTIDPNIGVVAVPDERVDKLAELTHSAKKIYTTIEFVDIAGLVKGAGQGEGLGNKFLANIREVNAIIYVLRAFTNENIINTQGGLDILRDKESLDTELAFKDLETLDKRIQGLQRENKSGINRELLKELDILLRAKKILETGKMLIDQDWVEDERRVIDAYQLLTMKPRIYLLNGREEEISPETIKGFEGNNWSSLIIDILTEFEAADLTIEERATLGLPTESGLDRLIKKSYKLLGLITFLTTGLDETRAWTLQKGKFAPQAGGVIHSDFERCFIKAEVINWQDLLNVSGFVSAREKGLIRTEGKEYIIKDGDVIEIKSNA